MADDASQKGSGATPPDTILEFEVGQPLQLTMPLRHWKRSSLRRAVLRQCGSHRRWWLQALQGMLINGETPTTYRTEDLARLPVPPIGARIRVGSTVYAFRRDSILGWDDQITVTSPLSKE